MFPLYGRKQRLVVLGKYPEPKYRRIIEPFAGAASYSMRYWEHDIVLVEKDTRLHRLWKWLQQQTPVAIRRLPLIDEGDSVGRLALPLEAKDFIGYWLARGSSRPNRVPGKFCGWNLISRARVAEDVGKIRHWKLILGDGMRIRNSKSTWFIDPPYQHGGHRYRCHEVDYKALFNFITSRRGQVIACENTKADWGNFDPLTKHRGVMFTTTEAVWLRRDSDDHQRTCRRDRDTAARPKQFAARTMEDWLR